MLCNRSIASAKTHVANLAFAKVFEHAVGPITIGISMFKPLFACDDNHQRMLRRRYDSTLLLSAKARVNIGTPIVDTAGFKSVGHGRRSLIRANAAIAAPSMSVPHPRGSQGGQ